MAAEEPLVPAEPAFEVSDRDDGHDTDDGHGGTLLAVLVVRGAALAQQALS